MVVNYRKRGELHLLELNIENVRFLQKQYHIKCGTSITQVSAVLP